MAEPSGAGKRAVGRADVAPADFFVVRTPLLPTSCARPAAHWPFGSGPATANPTAEESATIREAIWVSSSHLIDRIREASATTTAPKERARIALAARRYVLRMCRKPMTYGLFGGISVGKPGARTEFELQPREAYRRHVRIEHDVLLKVVQAATAPELVGLEYAPNSSLDVVFGRVRYAMEGEGTEERAFEHASVGATDVLLHVLEAAARGSTREALVRAIVEANDDVSSEDAVEYIDELIRSQILVHTVQAPITGTRSLAVVAAALEKAGAAAVAAELSGIQQSLDSVNTLGFGEAIPAYEAIAQRVAAVTDFSGEPSKVLHAELYKPAERATLGPKPLAEMLRVIDFQRRYFPGRGNPLTEFCSKFTERYGDQEVPLLEAVDELYVPTPGTPSVALGDTPIFELGGPVSPPGSEETRLGPRERYQLKRLLEALREGSTTIELRDREEWEPAEGTPRSPIPDSFVIATFLAARSAEDVDRGNFRLVEPRISSVYAAGMLGRFCEGAPELHRELAALCERETALQPDAVIADLASEPRIKRAASILVHPQLRPYEIEYRGRSGAPPDRRIRLSDLRVSVVGGRVLLHSVRLQKRVVVRQSHAFRRQAPFWPPVYQFLSSVELQDSAWTDGGWHWGTLASSAFLPRVVYGKAVLSSARWRISADDVKALHGAGAAAQLRPLRDRLRLPALVGVHERDDEEGLPLNLEDDAEAEVFLDLARGRGLLVSELLVTDEDCFVHGPEGAYRAQFIVPFVRHDVRDQPAPRITLREESVPQAPVARSLAPWDDALYAKLYVANGLREEILANIVAPFAAAAVASGEVRSWFYLFFTDPEPHIRVRLFGEARTLYEKTLPALHGALEPLLRDRSLWKLQLDTYNREIERYGGPEAIELAEQIFWVDSDASAALHAEILEAQDSQGLGWKCTALGVHGYLEAFGTPAPDRRAWVAKFAEGYAKEFSAGTSFFRSIGASFRKHRDGLAAALENPLEATGVPAVCSALEARNARLAPLASQLRALEQRGRLTRSVDTLLQSFVHMHACRMLPTALRGQELVLYHLLEKAYAHMAFRSGRESPSVDLDAGKRD